MECLECAIQKARPVGYGMNGWRGGAIVSIGGQKRDATDHTVPYGTDHVYPLPGISCLATLASSLRDRGYWAESKIEVLRVQRLLACWLLITHYSVLTALALAGSCPIDSRLVSEPCRNWWAGLWLIRNIYKNLQ